MTEPARMTDTEMVAIISQLDSLPPDLYRKARHALLAAARPTLAPQPAIAISIIPNEKGNPPGKLADAEIHFQTGPLSGSKLIGFAIWERRTGSGRNVTFPARQYSVNGERRSFALLRPAGDYRGLQDGTQSAIRDLILDAYTRHLESGTGQDGAITRWTYDDQGANLEAVAALSTITPGTPGTRTPMPAAESTETTSPTTDPPLTFRPAMELDKLSEQAGTQIGKAISQATTPRARRF